MLALNRRLVLTTRTAGLKCDPFRCLLNKDCTRKILNAEVSGEPCKQPGPYCPLALWYVLREASAPVTCHV
jgi:hypothetical protein